MTALIVGLGSIGQRHVRNLRRLVEPEVRLVAWRTRGRPDVLTERFEIQPGADVLRTYDIEPFDELDGALAQKPSIALICNPTSLHVPAALEAARAGCHLLVEKPLSHSLTSVDELVGAVRAKRLVGMMGYQMRFHPCFRRLRELLAERRVGSVLAVRAAVGEYLPGWHPYEDYRDLYASRDDQGGGVILSQIHEFDYLYALFGLPRRVFAVGGRLSQLDVDVEDTASVLMECQDGDRSIPVHVQQDYLQRPPVRTCEVVGEGGRIDVDFRAATVRVIDCAGRVSTDTFDGFDRNDTYLDEMRHFLACVDGQDRPSPSLDDGVHSLRMALAARESIETGFAVDL